MAPTDELVARAYGCGYGYSYDGFRCVRNSNWYFWGRWVVLGLALLFGFIVLISCICLQRRRRRSGGGRQPMYGTGWFGGGSNKPNEAHQMNNYQGGYNQGYDPNAGYAHPQQYGGGYSSPPPYGQPVNGQMTGTTFNTNEGYYSGQHYGVQPPQNAYQPEGHYQSPVGPPPGK